MGDVTVARPSLGSSALNDEPHYEVVSGQRVETPRMGSYESQVYVYHSPTRIDVLQRADTLEGGDVLPGFRLPLDALFATDDETE
jgi:hypothetical protein